MGNSPIIVALEAERIRLTRRLAELDELERAARAYVGEPAAPEPAKKAAVAPAKRRAKPGELELLLLEQLSQGAELSSPELCRKLGRRQATIDCALKRLFGNGKVHHDDGTPRKWSIIRSPTPKGAASALTAPMNGQPLKVPPSSEVTQAYLERKLLAHLQKGPATIAAAAAAIDADQGDVQTAVDRLLAAGELSRLEDGSYVG